MSTVVDAKTSRMRCRAGMCEHGDTVLVEVLVTASVSHSGLEERRVRPIDRCIADLVRALDAGGVDMLGSCCGHGKQSGEILLSDGRVLNVKRAAASFLDTQETPQ